MFNLYYAVVKRNEGGLYPGTMERSLRHSIKWEQNNKATL